MNSQAALTLCAEVNGQLAGKFYPQDASSTDKSILPVYKHKRLLPACIIYIYKHTLKNCFAINFKD